MSKTPEIISGEETGKEIVNLISSCIVTLEILSIPGIFMQEI